MLNHLKEVRDQVYNVKYRLQDRSLKRKVNQSIEVIVSLTTFPKRIKYLPIVIGSLLDQTVQPDRIIVYLSSMEFPNRNLQVINNLRKKGIEFEFRDGNFKAHKKYLYAMFEHPDAVIITVDDDCVYSKDTIALLLDSYKSHPSAVSAMRVHRIRLRNGKILPYEQWESVSKQLVDKECMTLFATGVGGVLYPPHVLDERFSDIEAIKTVCFTADDIWLKCMEVLKGTSVVCVKREKENVKQLFGASSKDGLATYNIAQNMNDVQLNDTCALLGIDLYKAITQPKLSNGKVSIIMLTYNAPQYVRHSIETLQYTEYYDFELIVYDNNSQSVTRELLKSYEKKGLIDRLVLANNNSLFCGGNNRAAKYASQDSQYLLLLNSDVEIRNRKWLLEMMRVHKRGLTACQLCCEQDNRPDGWCVLIDRDLFDTYKLDEDRFIWAFSVADLCARLMKDGYSVQTIEKFDRFIHHFGGSSEVSRKVVDAQEDYDVSSWFLHPCDIVELEHDESEDVLSSSAFSLYNSYSRLFRRVRRIPWKMRQLFLGKVMMKK